MKLQLEKKGVPLGNRLAKGTLMFHFLPRSCSHTAAGASGLRRWGDQHRRRCSEWYKKINFEIALKNFLNLNFFP